MKKYTIEVSRVRGTILTGKKGDVVELPSNSDDVKSLEKRGWITPFTAEATKNEVKPEVTKDETKPEEKPKKNTKAKK